MGDVAAPPATGTQGAEGADVQIFNSDIALNARDQQHLQTLYPKLAPYLIFPELHTAFAGHDKRANRAKRMGRRYGVVAIALATAALIAASISPQLDTADWATRLFAGIAAAAGIAGVAIALFGGLYSRAKRNWLCNRLMTERLRQFHFQTIVANALEIARGMSNPGVMHRLVEERRRALAAFLHGYEGQLPGQLSAVIGDDAEAMAWLAGKPAAHSAGNEPTPAERHNLDQIFDAYRLLRFEHQIRFGDFKLRKPGGIALGAPRSLSGLLTFLAFLFIAVTFAVHVIVGFFVAFGIGHEVENELHLAAVGLALLALAVRAFEEGLRPRHEVERYLRYRWTMSRLRDRFQGTTEIATKLAAMHEAEHASYGEMRDFLRTHEEALFVL